MLFLACRKQRQGGLALAGAAKVSAQKKKPRALTPGFQWGRDSGESQKEVRRPHANFTKVAIDHIGYVVSRARETVFRPPEPRVGYDARMCGRYALNDSAPFSETGLVWPADWKPSGDIAPTGDAVVLVGGEAPALEIQQWGLLPGWAKLKQSGPLLRWVHDGRPLFNSRDDQLGKRWKRQFEKRRCLIPASGFYEWSGPKKKRQRHYIALNDTPMMFGGIWAEREMPDGEILRTFSIITTTPNSLLERVHDRMPLIVGAKDYDAWLDGTPEQARQLVLPFGAQQMAIQDVSGPVS